MRLDEARRDLYRRLAKEQGYKSRAAFKLIEAVEKYKFVGEGSKVIDLGAAPGGWLQVCSRIVGESGKVVGVDISDIRVKGKNVTTIKMDVHDQKIGEALLRAVGGRADVILSDLAPSVSGVWELDQTRQVDLTLRVIEIADESLKPRGYAFFKLFEGERSDEVRKRFRSVFEVVRAMKPKASRNAASELYYYCEGWKGDDKTRRASIPVGPAPRWSPSQP
jgi:23S rRNA (uridine2552-2'-O)-methyltransferase